MVVEVLVLMEVVSIVGHCGSYCGGDRERSGDEVVVVVVVAEVVVVVMWWL